MSLRLARRRITAYTDSNRAIPLLIRQVLPCEANAVELFCCKRLWETLTIYVNRLHLPLRMVRCLYNSHISFIGSRAFREMWVVIGSRHPRAFDTHNHSRRHFLKRGRQNNFVDDFIIAVGVFNLQDSSWNLPVHYLREQKLFGILCSNSCKSLYWSTLTWTRHGRDQLSRCGC